MYTYVRAMAAMFREPMASTGCWAGVEVYFDHSNSAVTAGMVGDNKVSTCSLKRCAAY